jgi:hypothetical protein
VDKKSDGYLSHETKLTDVYSFGMLCLWVIFADELVDQFGINRDMTDTSTTYTVDHLLCFTRMSKLKEKDRLRVICRGLVSHLSLQSSQKASLTKFFDSSLSRNPLHRTLSMRQIRVLLDDSLSEPSGFSSETISDLHNKKTDMTEHHNFQVRFIRAVLCSYLTQNRYHVVCYSFFKVMCG